jgi:hypothetical protein
VAKQIAFQLSPFQNLSWCLRDFVFEPVSVFLRFEFQVSAVRISAFILLAWWLSRFQLSAFEISDLNLADFQISDFRMSAFRP